MLGAAAAFGGGIFVSDSLQKVKFPKLNRVKEDGVSFKLSVRVVSASIPAVSAPGVLSRQRPRLEASLGATRKGTELADFAADDDSPHPDIGACARECPWRFGDTLTFAACLADVLGPGLRLQMRAQSDIQIGPVQLEFSCTADLGEASVDLRRRVLPACVENRRGACDLDSTWESPLVLAPLFHVRGGKCVAGHGIGEAVAHVALVFSVDQNPESILDAADWETRTVADTLGVGGVVSWLKTPRCGSTRTDDNAMEDPMKACTAPPSPSTTPKMKSTAKDSATPTSASPSCSKNLAYLLQSPNRSDDRLLQAPDFAPNEWVCCNGPGGRTFWHNTALGPAPWEAEGLDCEDRWPVGAAAMAPPPAG